MKPPALLLRIAKSQAELRDLLKNFSWVEGTDALLIRDLEIRCLHRVQSKTCPWHVLTGPVSDKRYKTVPLGEYRARLILKNGPRPDLGIIIEL